MNVLLWGATGMVGQGVLRECLLDPDVRLVQTVGRAATGQVNPKLREIVHADLWDYSRIEDQLSGFDACFFCLGITSVGLDPAEYERITYGITAAVATTLAKLNTGMTFIFVSGAGSDSTERGSVRWARVKGKAENAVLRTPFKASYVFRPGMIQPLHGIQSKTASIRVLYSMTKPLLPIARAILPAYITTTEQIGRAMLAIAKHGAPKKVLENRDIEGATP